MEVKPAFMDSGTVMFKAENYEDALRIVSDVLLKEGGKISRSDKTLTLDFSSLLHTRLIEATIEGSSNPWIFAVSFREGNCGRIIRFALPSRKAVRRMNSIRKDMKAFQ